MRHIYSILSPAGRALAIGGCVVQVLAAFQHNDKLLLAGQIIWGLGGLALLATVAIYALVRRKVSHMDEENDARLYDIFHRKQFRINPEYPNGLEPHFGDKVYITQVQGYLAARDFCREWNATHQAGPLNDRAEFFLIAAKAREIGGGE
jgi:hypothetical protein